MSEVCNSKNCNCGKQHVYKDDLTEVAKGSLHKAMDTFEEPRHSLDQTDEIADITQEFDQSNLNYS